MRASRMLEGIFSGRNPNGRDARVLREFKTCACCNAGSRLSSVSNCGTESLCCDDYDSRMDLRWMVEDDRCGSQLRMGSASAPVG